MTDNCLQINSTGNLVWPRANSRLAGNDAKPDQAAIVLETLLLEMERRIEHLLVCRTDKFASINPDYPLLVMVLDELPGLLQAARQHDKMARRGAQTRTADRIQSAIGRLVREGAKVGICVITIAQRFDATTLGGDVRANFPTRVTFRVDNADAVHMLHPDVDNVTSQAITAQPVGGAWVDTPGRPGEHVQVDLMDYSDYVDVVTKGTTTP